MNLPEILTMNQVEYRVIKLLGRGKGGYSYLVEREGAKFVLKQIHHEPCDYYTFGNKMESEIRDYDTLSKLGIKMPKMIQIDMPCERILKEYVEGDTIFDIVSRDEIPKEYIEQVKEMCSILYPAGLNIDYYPTNFIPRDGILYYIDYECNQYSDEWNFENWGIQYWKK